ncbi:MAG TPA: CopD family protein [Gemmatimonadota bacterium]|nr:CopD family protein [Gemmatimonadota bacterium]
MNRIAAPVIAVAVAFAVGLAGTQRASGANEPAAAPHTELEESTPARDTVIDAALENVVLVFSGPVEAGLSRVRWVGPAGDTLALEVSPVPDRPHVLVASAPPAMNGPQRILWLTVSADGHQVAGVIPFAADIPGLAVPDTTPIADTGAAGTAGSDPGTAVEQDDSAVSLTSRLAVGGLGLFCLLGFAGLLWFGAGTTILDEPRSHRLASTLGLAAAVLLSLDFMLWLWSLRVPGVDPATTFRTALGTRTGVVEAGRVVLAAGAFLLFAGTRGVRLGAFLAMLAVVIGALGGHQATIQPLISLPANGLHLGAAAVWTGGVLLLGVWPSRPDPTIGVGWTFERIALRVSAAALLASGVILVTAIVQDLLYLPSLGALLSSTYGNLLLVKSGGFAALIAFGAYNRFRLIPALREANGHPTMRRSVRVELVVMIVVVLVAVALAQVPPPVE